MRPCHRAMAQFRIATPILAVLWAPLRWIQRWQRHRRCAHCFTTGQMAEAAVTAVLVRWRNLKAKTLIARYNKDSNKSTITNSKQRNNKNHRN